MPGSVTPLRDELMLRARFQNIEQRLSALERQQTLVFTDPTGTHGDPARGHAIFVTGNLAPYGIASYGAASFRTGSWVQL